MFDQMKIPDNITTRGNKTIEITMKEILVKNENGWQCIIQYKNQCYYY